MTTSPNIHVRLDGRNGFFFLLWFVSHALTQLSVYVHHNISQAKYFTAKSNLAFIAKFCHYTTLESPQSSGDANNILAVAGSTRTVGVLWSVTLMNYIRRSMLRWIFTLTVSGVRVQGLCPTSFEHASIGSCFLNYHKFPRYSLSHRH